MFTRLLKATVFALIMYDGLYKGRYADDVINLVCRHIRQNRHFRFFLFMLMTHVRLLKTKSAVLNLI